MRIEKLMIHGKAHGAMLAPALVDVCDARSSLPVKQLLDRGAQFVGYGRRSARIHVEVDTRLQEEGDLASVAAGHTMRQTQGRSAKVSDRRHDLDDVSHACAGEPRQVEFEG